MTAPLLTLYPRDNPNERDGRAYKNPFTGDTAPSVTTVLKQAPKNLQQWAANLTLEWAVQNWMLLGSRSTEDALKAGRYRWRDFRDERAEVGTGVHETIEALHNGSFQMPELDEEQSEMMHRWDELNQWHDIHPTHSEYTVWGEADGLPYAGTADGFWMIDGRPSLVDIKTSARIWDNHWMQLSALHNAQQRFEVVQEGGVEFQDRDGGVHFIEQFPVPEVEQYAIVHIRADHAEIHTREVDDPRMEKHWAQFRAYRQLHELERDLRVLNKDGGSDE